MTKIITKSTDVTKPVCYFIGYWLIVFGICLLYGKEAFAVSLMIYGGWVIFFGRKWKTKNTKTVHYE